VDSKGITINLHITSGNKHDSKIALKRTDKLTQIIMIKTKHIFWPIKVMTIIK